MIGFEKAVELLGHKVKVKATGYIGIVVIVSFNLKGEHIATTCPFGELDISYLKKGFWNWTQEFKVKDLEVLSKETVVDIPDFNNGEKEDNRIGELEKALMEIVGKSCIMGEDYGHAGIHKIAVKALEKPK